jgi:hypothetical protein
VNKPLRDVLKEKTWMLRLPSRLHDSHDMVLLNLQHRLLVRTFLPETPKQTEQNIPRKASAVLEGYCQHLFAVLVTLYVWDLDAVVFVVHICFFGAIERLSWYIYSISIS